MLTAICSFILICYIGFWAIAIFLYIFMETWLAWLIFIIVCIIVIIYNLCKEKAEEAEKRNNSIRQSVWFYCRYNGLKDVTSDSDRKLLDELAVNNKFGLGKFSFKNYVYDVVCNDELYARLDRGFINHSRIKSTNIYHKCRELRIKIGDIDGNDKKWSVISESFDVPVNVAKELYIRQCEEYIKQKEDEKEQRRIEIEEKKKEKELLIADKINKKKNKEEKLYFDEFDISKNVGKARYTYSNINIYSKLIDMSDVEEKVKLLNIEIGDYEITEFKNIIIPINFSYKRDIKLFGKAAVLDGSFRVSVLDKSNNLVAEGIVNGLVVGNKICGFKQLNKKVLCKCDDKKLIDGRKNYIIEVIPISLWMLEL